MGVTHGYVSTKDDPADNTVIGKTKWNANHNITGLYTWVLIEEKTLSGDSSTTFSDLDGDTDQEYLIEGDVDCGSISGGDATLKLTYNSIASTYNAQAGRYLVGQHEVSNQSYQELGRGGWGSTCSILFDARVRVKTGNQKAGLFKSNIYNISGHTTTNIYMTGQFGCDDTATEVTSMTVTAVNCTITGKIRLYKKVPVS